MNAVKKHRGWALPVSLLAGALASALGVYFGYQFGLRAYDDLLLDEALAEIYYVSNPVDRPPCAEGATYEWFYAEPPGDSKLWEEQYLPGRKEAAVGEHRHRAVKPQKPVSNGND